MKLKFFVAIIASLVISHFMAYPIGKWFVSQYAGPGWFSIGPFAGYDQGFLFSYILLSSLLVTFFSRRFKYGFYAALPVLLFDLITGSVDPQLWMDLVLLALGLGLAYVILLFRQKAGD